MSCLCWVARPTLPLPTRPHTQDAHLGNVYVLQPPLSLACLELRNHLVRLGGGVIRNHGLNRLGNLLQAGQGRKGRQRRTGQPGTA